MDSILTLLIDIDTSILLWINSLNHPGVDRCMMVLTGRWVWIPFYVFLAYLLYRRLGMRRAVLAVVLAGIAVGIADMVCAELIRPFIGRYRPANLSNPIHPLVHIVDGYRGGPFGFPSCHAANSSALAVFIMLTLRNRAIAILMSVWVFLMVYTRMYLGVHYPGDILAGFIVGSLAGYGMYRLYRYLSNNSRIVSPRLA